MKMKYSEGLEYAKRGFINEIWARGGETIEFSMGYGNDDDCQCTYFIECVNCVRGYECERL